MDGKNINNIKGVSNSTANNKIPNNQKVAPLPNLKKSLPNPQNANILNKRNEDIQRLNQALSKKRELENKQESTQEQEKKTIGQKVDKVGEEAVRNFGGKALTAATGGAVSGPAADAIANAVAKPVGKMLKYSLFITVAPILFILLICFSIFAAYYTLEEGSDSSNSEVSTTTSEGGVCSYKVRKGKDVIKVSNVKVRLLQCKDGKLGEPIEGEELVDLEKYILGVVYAEIGGGAGAGAKAQAIAARSYSLKRTNPAGEKGLEKQDDGTWIVSLRNCTSTQVYCDPDKGCTVKNGAPNATNNTVYSGKIAGKQQYKGPMAQNDKTRTAIAGTAGQVAINSKGEVIATDYTQTQQDLFDQYAKEGMDAFEIIKKVYPNVNSIQSSCESTTGDFAKWKQCGAPWSNIEISSSSKNICNIGCAATSISIQIANSKTSVTIPTLNPGTFVEALNANGGFTSNGLIFWEKASIVAPKFKLSASENINGNAENKASKLQEYLNNNEYVVIGVHKSASDGITHWVALDKVIGNDVYIFDPGSKATKLFDQYPYTKNRDIAIRRYKLS